MGTSVVLDTVKPHLAFSLKMMCSTILIVNCILANLLPCPHIGTLHIEPVGSDSSKQKWNKTMKNNLLSLLTLLRNNKLHLNFTASERQNITFRRRKGPFITELALAHIKLQ
jgi:hypothetical protein